jgi:acyl carrier protein
MTEEEIKSIVFGELKKIAPESAPEKLKPDDQIREVLDIDSFDSLQFIIALNKKLGIDIAESDYGKTNTLKNLIAFILSKWKA